MVVWRYEDGTGGFLCSSGLGTIWVGVPPTSRIVIGSGSSMGKLKRLGGFELRPSVCSRHVECRSSICTTYLPGS